MERTTLLKRQATPRAARSVQKILDAAAKLFGRDGYQGASMMSVARAAGVSKGLLHYHFRSKEHLLIEAQRVAFRKIHSRFEARTQRGEHGLNTPLDGLDALWESVRDLRTWAPFMVETMSLTAQDGPIRHHLDLFYKESMELLIQGIERVFHGDIPRLIIPPERLAWVVRTTVHGLVVELAYARDEEALTQIDRVYQDTRTIFARMALLEPLSAPQQEGES